MKNSDYIEWYEHGLAELRANLHFKRAEFENRNIAKGDADFKNSEYMEAIKCWDKLPERSSSREYFTAQKLISATASEEIKWMDKLGESADILSRYSDIDFAQNLTIEAQNIVFNCLLAKDMSKALAYPFPKDKETKWNTLYTKDRANFLRMIILKDFTLEKFSFLRDKVEGDDYNVFLSKTPSDIFDSIFRLNGSDEAGKPYWAYFVADLKDITGERLFKSSSNRDAILEALSKVIKESPTANKTLATCFLEMLFDEEYNAGRARKYLEVISILFRHGLFFKEDFRYATQRNAYFTKYCPIASDDIDRLKGNIHRFAHDYLTGLNKKVSAQIIDDTIKPLFMAYEISVPYQNTYPDYTNICSEYRIFLNDKGLKKIFEIPSTWIKQRLAFNKLLEDSLLGKSTFAQILDAFKGDINDIEHFVLTISKEDTIAFILATNRPDSEYSYVSILTTAKVIYTKRLRRDDFRPYCMVNQLRDTLAGFVDLAIKELLSNKSHVNEYEIKLLTFVWEALGDHAFAAVHYDDLIDRKRLDKVTRLKNYFKHRALLHYSYLKQKDFEEKQIEYNIKMAKDNLPSAYPRIEKEDENSPQKKNEPTRPNELEPTVQQNAVTNSVDPVKQAMIEMAHKMKESGMDIEQIMKFTNLSKLEVRKA